jgi:hypothetical protein
MRSILVVSSSIAIGVSAVGAAFSMLSGRADLFILALGLGVASVTIVEVSK